MEVGGKLAVNFVVHAEVHELAWRLIDVFEKVPINGDITVFDRRTIGRFENFTRVVGGERETQIANAIRERGVEGAFDGSDLEAAVDRFQDGCV